MQLDSGKAQCGSLVELRKLQRSIRLPLEKELLELFPKLGKEKRTFFSNILIKSNKGV